MALPTLYLALLIALAISNFCLRMTSAMGTPPPKPNIVFILVDDQDLLLNSLDLMDNLQKHLVQKGTFFSKHYGHVSQCCPVCERVKMAQRSWAPGFAHLHPTEFFTRMQEKIAQLNTLLALNASICADMISVEMSRLEPLSGPDSTVTIPTLPMYTMMYVSQGPIEVESLVDQCSVPAVVGSK